MRSSAEDYPQVWEQGALSLPVTYQFEPGAEADGVTVHIPVDVLNQVVDVGFDWQVPGLRQDLATALLKSLPKATRRHFVPTPDHAQAALADSDASAGAWITDELGRALKARTGFGVDAQEWDWTRVPDHLRITFRVEDRSGRVLAEGKDLRALQDRLAPQMRQTMAQAAGAVERQGLSQWSFGPLPATFEQRRGERVIQGFPSVVDHGDSVSVEVLPTQSERDHATRLGVRRLLLLNTTAPWKRVLALLSNAQKLALGNNPHGSVPALLDDCLACAVDSIVAERPGGSVLTPEDFEDTLAAVRRGVVARVIEVIELVEPVLVRAREVELGQAALSSPVLAPARADMERQLRALVRPGFVADTGFGRLRHLERYLRAMRVRQDKVPGEVARDAERSAVVERVEHERAGLLAELPPARRTDPDVVELRWMVEELRVSLFAQTLGTAHPVSEKRIYKAMDAIEG